MQEFLIGLQGIIAGGGDAVITVLLMVILALGFAIRKLWKKIDDKEQAATVQTAETTRLAKEFRHSIESIIQVTNEQHLDTQEAFNKINVVLAELKGKLG